jgi:hypothetical protein
VDPTTTLSSNKYNAVLAAIATSSSKDLETPVRTTTTHFPNIPDADTRHLLTPKDSKGHSKSRHGSYSAADTDSQQNNSQVPKSHRVTSTSAFSLAESFSTPASKPAQPPRSRSAFHRISPDSSVEPALGRKVSEVVTLSTPLSSTSASDSQSTASARNQDGNAQRTATKSFRVADNINNINSKASSQDAESSAIENSFTQNNDGHRRDKEHARGSSRTDPVVSVKFQRQRGVTESVQRIRLVPESTTAPSSDSHESPRNQSSVVSSRIPQSRQPETVARNSKSETLTSRSTSQTAGIETVSSSSVQTSTSSQQNETHNETNPTTSPSALRPSYHSSLVEADDVHSGLSRNSVVQQSDVATNNRARSRGSGQRKRTSCADAVDTNSNAGCSEQPQIRYNFCNNPIRQNNCIKIQNRLKVFW